MFKFEDKNYDFPFYNDNPHLSVVQWIIIVLSIFVGLAISSITSNQILSGIIFSVVMFVPLYVYCKKDLTKLVHKITKWDLLLIVGMFIGYIIYAILMDFILGAIGIPPTESGTIEPFTIYKAIELIFSLFAEELIKLIPFLLFLTIIYKVTHNRKVAIIVSALIVMIFFGSLHFTYSGLLYGILIQGLGSIFEFFGYIKTKNLLVPFLTHYITDVSIYILSTFFMI